MRNTRSFLKPLVLCAVLAASPVGCSGGAEHTRITLLGTTDFHGHLLPWDYPGARPTEGSLAQLGTLVERIREAEENVLLVDSGDFLQGSELTDHVAATGIDGVHPVIAAMNALGYDAVAMGNHEYNHGIAFLEEALDDAEFPVLSANIYRAGTEEPALPPYVVVERDGVRVGFLGLTTPGIAIWDRDHVEGRFRFEDVVESARRWMPELLAEGPDLVVAVAHSGIGPGSTYDEAASGVPEEDAVDRLVRAVEGIDVVFAGHSAGPVEGHLIEDTLVIHAGHSARHLAVVRVSLERDGPDDWRVVDRSSELLDVEGLPSHPGVEAAVLPAHERTLAWLEQPIGTTPDTWSAAEARVRDTPVADLIMAAMRAAAPGAEIASTPILDPAVSFGPGPISRRDILALYRYPNRLKAIRVTGAQLRAYLERSAAYYESFPAENLVNDDFLAFNYDVVDGLHYRIDLTRPVGERVLDLRHDGEPVAPEDTFVLAINSYRQAGGGGFEMLTDAPVVSSDDTLVSELIIDYIRRLEVVRHEDVFRPNWSLEPPAAVERLLRTEATRSRY